MKFGYLIALCLSMNPLFCADNQPVCTGTSPSCKQLNEWYQEGTAAGNKGDYYDNRDRGHSRINLEQYPQVNEVIYTFDERSQYKDWGGQLTIQPHVTIGNSSTAGSLGSNARAHYYTSQDGMAFLNTQYHSNNLYIYPEHKDYDPANEMGRNDVLPTNSPYLILSKGSSGSDRPFIDAFLRTLAAFNPNVKTTLINSGALMPTLQQIFRSSNAPVVSKGDYLTGKAHPPVFEGKNIELEKMIEKAHALTIKDIPPLISLKELRVKDDSPTFNPLENEFLASTQEVIAKVYRGNEPYKKIIVTAKESQDLLARPLTFHWVVLNNDDKGIKIETKDDGKTAEIIIPYQHPFIVDDGRKLKSSRIDIGVFADNGTSISAPGFITIYSLPNELRTYDDKGKLQEVFYAADEKGFNVKSWSELIGVVTRDEGTFATELLRENFSPEQISFFKKELPKIQILEQAVWTAQAQLDNVKELRKKLGNRMVPYKEVVNAKKTLNEEMKAFQAALNQKQMVLNNRSIKEDMLMVINAYINDLTFYPREKQMIKGEAIGKEQQLHKLVSRLTSEGVFEKSPKDLTKYEKSEIEGLNLYIISNILYPNSLIMWEQPYYIDPRLGKPQKILRRFNYDSEGNLKGHNDLQVH